MIKLRYCRSKKNVICLFVCLFVYFQLPSMCLRCPLDTFCQNSMFACTIVFVIIVVFFWSDSIQYCRYVITSKVLLNVNFIIRIVNLHVMMISCQFLIISIWQVVNILHFAQFSVSCCDQYAVNHNLTAEECIPQIKSWTNCANLTNCKIIARLHGHPIKHRMWPPFLCGPTHQHYTALCFLILCMSFQNI